MISLDHSADSSLIFANGSVRRFLFLVFEMDILTQFFVMLDFSAFWKSVSESSNSCFNQPMVKLYSL
jgi:hypothetical protein